MAVGGALCAGAFNPAVAITVGIAKILSWKLVAWTVFANLLSAVCSALIFKFVYTEE